MNRFCLKVFQVICHLYIWLCQFQAPPSPLWELVGIWQLFLSQSWTSAITGQPRRGGHCQRQLYLSVFFFLNVHLLLFIFKFLTVFPDAFNAKHMQWGAKCCWSSTLGAAIKPKLCSHTSVQKNSKCYVASLCKQKMAERLDSFRRQKIQFKSTQLLLLFK